MKRNRPYKLSEAEFSELIERSDNLTKKEIELLCKEYGISIRSFYSYIKRYSYIKNTSFNKNN